MLTTVSSCFLLIPVLLLILFFFDIILVVWAYIDCGLFDEKPVLFLHFSGAWHERQSLFSTQL